MYVPKKKKVIIYVIFIRIRTKRLIFYYKLYDHSLSFYQILLGLDLMSSKTFDASGILYDTSYNVLKSFYFSSS